MNAREAEMDLVDLSSNSDVKLFIVVNCYSLVINKFLGEGMQILRSSAF